MKKTFLFAGLAVVAVAGLLHKAQAAAANALSTFSTREDGVANGNCTCPFCSGRVEITQLDTKDLYHHAR